jgi:hypothetical protein
MVLEQIRSSCDSDVVILITRSKEILNEQEAAGYRVQARNPILIEPGGALIGWATNHPKPITTGAHY